MQQGMGGIGGLLGKFGGIFQPGGALGAQQLPPELAAAVGEGVGSGAMGLLGNPALMAGLGMLQGNQSGQGIAGGIEGLQMANKQSIDQQDRIRNDLLRQQLSEYFSASGQMGGDAGNVAQEADIANSQAMSAASNGNGMRNPPNTDISRMNLLQLMLGMDNGNSYGGINPFLIGR